MGFQTEEAAGEQPQPSFAEKIEQEISGLKTLIERLEKENQEKDKKIADLEEKIAAKKNHPVEGNAVVPNKESEKVKELEKTILTLKNELMNKQQLNMGYVRNYGSSYGSCRSYRKRC